MPLYGLQSRVFGRSWQGRPITCILNPERVASKELEEYYRPAEKPKRVLVIGGGPQA